MGQAPRLGEFVSLPQARLCSAHAKPKEAALVRSWRQQNELEPWGPVPGRGRGAGGAGPRARPG